MIPKVLVCIPIVTGVTPRAYYYHAEMWEHIGSQRLLYRTGRWFPGPRKSPRVIRNRAATELLKANEHVDPLQIGAIGYCFGGGVILAMAREGSDLKAVVSFHGSLATQHPAEKGKVKAKVLVCSGADDKLISADDIKKFKEEMKTAGVDYKFVNYPGAMHGFSNPAATELGKKFKIAIAYNKTADKESWDEMQKLFRKAFKNG